MPVLSRFHKVQSVAALPDFVLAVRFSGEEEKRYDMKPVFAAWPMFEGLSQSPELFGEVAVGSGGYGVVWGDEWDVGADELFANGVGNAQCTMAVGEEREVYGAAGGAATGRTLGECTMQNAECTRGEGGNGRTNHQTTKRSNDSTILRGNDLAMQRSNDATNEVKA